MKITNEQSLIASFPRAGVFFPLPLPDPICSVLPTFDFHFLYLLLFCLSGLSSAQFCDFYDVKNRL